MHGKAITISSRYGAYAFVAFVFLFAGAWETSPGLAGSLLRGLMGILEDARTQWVIFLFFGIYFTTFLVLRMKAHANNGTAASALLSVQHDGACIWIIAVLGVCAFNYVSHYSASSEALIFVTGAVLGQGLIAWAGFQVRNQPVTTRTNLWLSAIAILVGLLALASVWRADSGQDFEYQGLTRWIGPWDNPNLYGLLMAAGVLLATGLIIQCFKYRNQKRAGRFFGLGWGNGALAILCFLAVLFMARGLFHSYSRGAWLGTLCGLAALCGPGLWALGVRKNSESAFEISRPSRLQKNWVPALVILAAGTLLCFWQFRQTSWHPARRAFSAVNTADFSWRNRVAAWEGALQITAEHPWLGAGWNQPEPLYAGFYLPARLDDGLAIQMNDYLLFSASLGLPALFCFGMYLWLSLTWKSAAEDSEPETEPREREAGRTEQVLGRKTFDSLRSTCRAGAIALLVGFWFDGGLFKLPTAVTFWVLLELGGLCNHQICHLAQAGVQRLVKPSCASRRRTSGRLLTAPRLNLGHAANRHKTIAPAVRRGASVRTRKQPALV